MGGASGPISMAPILPSGKPTKTLQREVRRRKRADARNAPDLPGRRLREAPHPDDRRTRARGAPDGGVTEEEALASGGHAPVAVAAPGGRHADDRRRGCPGGGAPEGCVAAVE